MTAAARERGTTSRFRFLGFPANRTAPRGLNDGHGTSIPPSIIVSRRADYSRIGPICDSSRTRCLTLSHATASSSSEQVLFPASINRVRRASKFTRGYGKPANNRELDVLSPGLVMRYAYVGETCWYNYMYPKICGGLAKQPNHRFFEKQRDESQAPVTKLFSCEPARTWRVMHP